LSGFRRQLEAAWARSGSLVGVGLAPEVERLPRAVAVGTSPIFEFNKAIVDATADLVCAYKPQFAHYAACGAEDQLERTIDYIHRCHPGIPDILDAKRGDVGSTAKRYAIEAFERYGADAVTVNPYLGSDSLEPFLAYDDRGVIILCRTSNAGARDLQDLRVGRADAPPAEARGGASADRGVSADRRESADGGESARRGAPRDAVPEGRSLYQTVAWLAARRWNARGNCALVVGAPYPAELGEVRSIVGDMPLLVPGVGAQGGDVEQVIRNGRTREGTGLIISSSRAVLYASPGDDFAAAARVAAQSLKDAIDRHRHARARTV
jgi:orotidine-5'-phosphate decarboxylase